MRGSSKKKGKDGGGEGGGSGWWWLCNVLNVFSTKLTYSGQNGPLSF